MGIFDGILGGIFGAGATKLLDSYIEKQGGLQNVVSQFEKTGFGNTVKSWISMGQNLPISADQIRQALGSDMVKQLSAKTGLPADKIADMLAQHLPQAIDKVTPDGKLPSKLR